MLQAASVPQTDFSAKDVCPSRRKDREDASAAGGRPSISSGPRGGLRITALKAAHGRYKHPYKQSAVGSLAPEALVSSLQWARARTIRKRTNQPR